MLKFLTDSRLISKISPAVILIPPAGGFLNIPYMKKLHIVDIGVSDNFRCV